MGPVRLRERGEDSTASHQAEGVNEEQEASQPRTVTLAEGPGAHNMASQEAEGKEKKEAMGQVKPVHLLVHGGYNVMADHARSCSIGYHGEQRWARPNVRIATTGSVL